MKDLELHVNEVRKRSTEREVGSNSFDLSCLDGQFLRNNIFEVLKNFLKFDSADMVFGMKFTYSENEKILEKLFFGSHLHLKQILEGPIKLWMLIKFLPSFTEITIDDIRLRVIVEVETNSAPLRFEKNFSLRQFLGLQNWNKIKEKLRLPENQ